MFRCRVHSRLITPIQSKLPTLSCLNRDLSACVVFSTCELPGPCELFYSQRSRGGRPPVEITPRRCDKKVYVVACYVYFEDGTRLMPIMPPQKVIWKKVRDGYEVCMCGKIRRRRRCETNRSARARAPPTHKRRKRYNPIPNAAH